jgi:hypothetical protein
MSAIKKRSTAALIAVAAATLAVVAFSPPAEGAPYSGQPTLSVTTQTPAAGGSLVLTGLGFGVNEDVSDTLHTVTYTLAGAHTDSSGGFSVTVTLPAGVTGSHTIVSKGLTSGITASISISIGGTSSGGSSSGGLSSTGVAVVGIAGLGTALLIGGGIMLMAGKRRKVKV